MAYRPPLERRISILHPSPRLFPVSAAFLSAALPAQAAAAPAAQGRTVTLRPGPLATALTDLARQAGWQLLFDPALVRGRSIKRATRAADAKKLLERLLRDNALEARWLPGGTLLIVPRAPSRAPPPAAEADNQPVIVTALKRETVMAETPLSMSVERGNVLADRGVHDIRTLARRHPELSVVDTGTGQQRLLIRGLASAGEPTVGIYYDESAISGPGGTTFDPSAFAPDLDLVDIDRVELLRGPQGTLYGASAMGGVVRVIFNQPDPTAWHGEARAGVDQTSGAGPGGSASLMLNAPIVADQLAARMSLYARRAGGVIRNDHLDIDHGGRTDKSGGRVNLAWTPQDGTSIQGSAIVQRTRISDAAFWYRAQGRNINDQSARTPQRNDLTLYNLTARHDLGGVTALATVSHYTWNIVREIDYTGVLSGQRDDPAICRSFFGLAATENCSAAQVAAFGSFVDSRLPGILYQPMRVADWSAELRFSSTGSGAAKWAVGAYLERRREHIASYALKVDAATGIMPRPLDVTGLRYLDSMLSQQALFGEWTQGLTRALALTLGGRLFRYVRASGGNVDIPNPITGTGALQGGRYASREIGSNLKALLSWHPAEALLVYAEASQGYRPGGVNIIPLLAPGLRVYRADRLWSYELGGKASAFDRRVSINADVYRIDWSDMIYPVSSANGAFAYNSNAGSAAIHGAELELTVAADPRTTIEGRASLTDARLSRNQPIDTSGIIARKGDRLPNVPLLAFALGMQRREPLSPTTTAIARIDFGYTSAMNTAFNRTDPYFERTAPRTQLDLQLLVEQARWNAGLSIRNLLDNKVPARIASGPAGVGQVWNALPRTASLDVAYRF